MKGTITQYTVQDHSTTGLHFGRLKEGGHAASYSVFSTCDPLLIYTAELSTADILEAMCVDEQQTEVQPGDSIISAFLRRKIVMKMVKLLLLSHTCNSCTMGF